MYFAVVRGTADHDALAGDVRHPLIERFGRAGDASRGHDDAHLGAAGDLVLAFAAFDADDAVLRLVIEEALHAHAVVDLELALFELLHKHFDVVAALEGFLTHAAVVRVTGIGFDVVLGETAFGEPVESFARVLGEGVDRFLQAHVVAVGDDVLREGFPGVLDRGIGLLHLRAVGGEKTAAEVRRGVEGALALVEDFDFGARVVRLAGGHHAGAAATEDDDVGFHIPLFRESGLRARVGEARKGSGGGSGRNRGAEEVTTGQIGFRHDHSPFILMLNVWQSLHSKRGFACMLWQFEQSASPRCEAWGLGVIALVRSATLA